VFYFKMNNLLAVSQFFKKATFIQNGWLESKYGMFVMEAIEPSTAAIFQHYVHTGRIEDNTTLLPGQITSLGDRFLFKSDEDLTLSESPADNDKTVSSAITLRLETLVNLYLVADYFVAPKLQNAVMDRIIDCYEYLYHAHSMDFFYNHLEDVDANSRPKSPLRRLTIDLARVALVDCPFVDTRLIPSDILGAVNSPNSPNSPKIAPWKRGYCWYHQHLEGQWVAPCGNFRCKKAYPGNVLMSWQTRES
jgi:hypothetical protein